MKTLLFSASLLAAAAVQAVSQIEVLSSSSQDKSRLVTVDFTLDAPAVVTADVCTNRGDGVYVTIGLANFTNLTGPLNRLTDGGTYRATWQPVDSWPSNKVENLRVVLKAWAPENPPPYMVVDLTDKTAPAEYYTCAEAVPGGVTARIYKTDKMVFRKIDAAGVGFDCGRTPADAEFEPQYFAAQETIHRVRFSKDYYIAVFETTQKQHQLATGATPSGYRGESYPDADVMPVERLAFYGNNDSNQGLYYKMYGYNNRAARGSNPPTTGSVIGLFRTKTGIDTVDMPSDAQWEYACRAGCPWPFSDWSATSTDIAWSTACVPAPTCPQEVGLKEPNAFGLYDMLGNVNEYMRTIFASPTGADEVDPEGPDSGTQLTVRGGAWNSSPKRYCRSAYRGGVATGYNYSATPDIGYRLICAAQAVK